jgi:hypothetical protein
VNRAFFFALAAAVFPLSGCSSLTHPEEISVAVEPVPSLNAPPTPEPARQVPAPAPMAAPGGRHP